MTLRAQPPIDQWDIRSHDHTHGDVVRQLARNHVNTPHTPELVQTGPIIATGHQAGLWHPGILAKYVALRDAAKRYGAGAFHVVVDQDVNAALELDLPVRDGNKATVHRVVLGRTLPDVPTGRQDPTPPGEVAHKLKELSRTFGDRLMVRLDRLIEAFTDLPACTSLAQQLTAVLDRLFAPMGLRQPVVMAGDLANTTMFRELVEAMLADAAMCVKHYNQAVADHPQAGMAMLRVESDRVELPLWHVPWGKPRARVFADLADSEPLLTLENGQPVRLEELAPRALLLTAALRSGLCDLFIHGSGGWTYDRITEQWWRQWRGYELSPMAMVTADVTLADVDALGDLPVNEPTDYRRAVWFAHHLPHNLDRTLGLDTPEVRRKRALLAHMDDDRDRSRRAEAFAQIHAINDALARQHHDRIAQARGNVERTKQGMANRALARRRDWCFAIYPDRFIREIQPDPPAT